MLILRLLGVIIVLVVVQCTISNPQLLRQTPQDIKSSLQELLNNRKKLAGARLLFPANAVFATHIKIEYLTGVGSGQKDPVHASFYKAHFSIMKEVTDLNKKSAIMIHKKNALIHLVLEQSLAFKDEELLERVNTPRVGSVPSEVYKYIRLFISVNVSSKDNYAANATTIAKRVNVIFKTKNPNYKLFMMQTTFLGLIPHPSLPIFIQHYKRFLSLLDYIFGESVLHIPSEDGTTMRDLWSIFGFQYELYVDRIQPLDGSHIRTRAALLAAQAGALYLLINSKLGESGDNLKLVSEKFIEKLLPSKSKIVKLLLGSG